MQPKDFKNIIFDFGGVILNLDYQRTIDAFKKQGIPQFEQNYSQLQQTELFDDFERGTISSADFRERLRGAFNTTITDAELDAAWNAMLLDLPAERLQLLEQLRASKNICMLSNTNEIHVACFEADLKKQHGLENLNEFFDHVYYSCRTGMRKPEARIFEMVLKQQNHLPQETLFIDDSPQHIQGAKEVGLQVYHLRADKGETIHDLFG